MTWSAMRRDERTHEYIRIQYNAHCLALVSLPSCLLGLQRKRHCLFLIQ